MSSRLVWVKDLKKYFPVQKTWLPRLSEQKEWIHAVDGIDFFIRSGETLTLVGESGSGKTTTGRLILRLMEPTSGEIFFDGRNLLHLKKKDMQKLRREMQIIFQNPYASLNPRMRVRDIVGENLEIHGVAKGVEKENRVIELLQLVRLTPAHNFIDRHPHEFSGGQRQRIGIARALALNPRFIVADEPVSSLDVSIRAQILNLMQDLKQDLGLTYLLIAHNLAVVRYMSDRIAVMYLGKIMELARSDDLYDDPQHPYTKALISSCLDPIPDANRERIILKGEIPSPINPPKGCRFQTRCPYQRPICKTIQPILTNVGGEHLVACHLINN